MKKYIFTYTYEVEAEDDQEAWDSLYWMLQGQYEQIKVLDSGNWFMEDEIEINEEV